MEKNEREREENSKALNHVEANNEIPSAIVPYILWLLHRLTAAVNCRVI